MSAQPSLASSRLLLRPLREQDAEAVVALAGQREIAATTLRIPHPYESSHARQWIARTAEIWRDGAGVVFAIERRSERTFIGAVGVDVDTVHRHAEMGYWIGRPYWNHGYATEAAAALLDFTFARLQVHRVHAHHFRSNPASGRVLDRIGMSREGELREHMRKWDRYEDIVLYGILDHEHTRMPDTCTIIEPTEPSQRAPEP